MLNYRIKVIDNFLKREDYNELCKIFLNKGCSKNISVFHNEISNNGVIKSSIDEGLLTSLHQSYFSKAIEILKELNPEKIELYDYSDFSIVITKKNKEFPIHDDTPDKLLSGVIYLHPEENVGTFFFNSKRGEDKETIEWKKNRAVFFSRKEKTTWHSYKSNDKSNRITLVYNLKTFRVKKVFEIEKRNFLLGYLRFKLNPYIYRLLKKTI